MRELIIKQFSKYTYETANNNFSVIPLMHDAQDSAKMRTPKKICRGKYDDLILIVSPGKRNVTQPANHYNHENMLNQTS